MHLGGKMIPIGYVYKRVAQKPDWVTAANVDDIYSVSGHASKNFAEYIKYWKHNGYWMFDRPAAMKEISIEERIDLSDMTLFYYEAFEKQFDEHTKGWSRFEPEPSFPTHVEEPRSAHLEGYDVTTFYLNNPQCSPLSCNDLAKKIAVNRHCLFETFNQAKEALEAGKFDNSEEGPFRIIAVFTLG